MLSALVNDGRPALTQKVMRACTPTVAGWIEPDGDESALAIFDPEGLSATSLRGAFLISVFQGE